MPALGAPLEIREIPDDRRLVEALNSISGLMLLGRTGSDLAG